MKSHTKLISFAVAVTISAAIYPATVKSEYNENNVSIAYTETSAAENGKTSVITELQLWLESIGSYEFAEIDWEDIFDTTDPTEIPTEAATAEPTATSEPTDVPTEEPTATPTTTDPPIVTIVPVISKLEEWISAVDDYKLAIVEWSDMDSLIFETPEPTIAPTPEPTAEPTVVPTFEPTVVPTPEPTAEPTIVPTLEPTVVPTLEPTVAPTLEPTVAPTPEPTATPTPEASAEPDIKCSISVNTVRAEASINIINTFDYDKSVVVFVAQYSDTGVLVGIKAEEIIVSAKTIIPAEYTVRSDTISGNMEYIKVFVWDTIEEMKPINVLSKLN